MAKVNLLEDKALVEAVRTEIETGHSCGDYDGYLDSFKEFWAEVDVINAYEEEWKTWKRKGIKKVYEMIYNEKFKK